MLRQKPAARAVAKSEPALTVVDDLVAWFPVADGMAALFSPFVEAVVHDLRTDTIAWIAHPFAPRHVGDPSHLGQTELGAGAAVLGPYEKVNFDGRLIKSVSIVLRDAAGRAVGMLCVNADVTEFAAVQRMLGAFLGAHPPSGDTEALFRDDWHEKINRFVAAWTAERRITLDRLDRAARRDLIAALHKHGGFEGGRAPAYVAAILGVSRATVYNELARLKA